MFTEPYAELLSHREELVEYTKSLDRTEDEQRNVRLLLSFTEKQASSQLRRSTIPPKSLLNPPRQELTLSTVARPG